MARKRRMARVGFYHVINRGVAKGRVFFDQGDYRKFLEIAEEASREYRFEVFSFCLMPNHYHYLLKTKEANLSRFMQKIGSRYSLYFNHRYDRVGPLWQGRFKAFFVLTDKHLHSLVRYIELNPVKAGITKKIGQYQWAMSSAGLHESSGEDASCYAAVHFQAGRNQPSSGKKIQSSSESSESLLDIAKLSMLNYELLNRVSLEAEMSTEEQAQIEEVYRSNSVSRNSSNHGDHGGHGVIKGALHNDTDNDTDNDTEDIPPLSSYFSGVELSGAGLKKRDSKPTVGRNGRKGGSGIAKTEKTAKTKKTAGKRITSESINALIAQAVRDGHRSADVARYLGVSRAAISKRLERGQRLTC